jgi:sulfur carrier protein ThiS
MSEKLQIANLKNELRITRNERDAAVSVNGQVLKRLDALEESYDSALRRIAALQLAVANMQEQYARICISEADKNIEAKQAEIRRLSELFRNAAGLDPCVDD